MELYAKKELVEEIGGIFEKVKEPLPLDVATLRGHLSECNALLARAGQLVADAQYYVNQKKGERALQEVAKDKPIAPTYFKLLLDRYAIDEIRILTQAEKAYSVTDTRIESIRTLISFEKQQIGR